MKNPILSIPIDKELDRLLKRDVKQSRLSRADVVRQILRTHYGLLKRSAA